MAKEAGLARESFIIILIAKTTIAVAAHPGWTETNLQQHSGLARFFNRFFAQPQPMGALPTLMAAIDPDARSGDYFGPSGFMEMRGHPQKVDSNDRSHNRADAQKLWEVSEAVTGVSYNWKNNDK